MEGTARQPTNQPALAARSRWRLWLFYLVLGLWVLQLPWLVWQLREELADVVGKVADFSGGTALRQADQFYRWLLEVSCILPPDATYVFLDDYEAGKEIEARYHLFPRRHLLLLPETPPSRLFHTLRQDGVAYVLVRDEKQPLGPGLAAALELDTAERLSLPGPGLVFRVNPERLAGGFYD